MFISPDLYNDHPEKLNLAQQQSRNNLAKHIEILAGDIGARSLTRAQEALYRAAAYIEQTFENLNYGVRNQHFNATVSLKDINNKQINQSMPTRNLIAEIKGKALPNEIVIVGAHYDTEYSSPGANDNGSGVAALLELAELFSNRASLGRTLRFVAFSNEEQPFCDTNEMGSKIYADECKQYNENIVAMLCLETIGYYSDKPGTQTFPDESFNALKHDAGNFISFVSNIESSELLKKCIGDFRASLKFPSIAIAAQTSMRGIDFSDHRNFWRLGYPAIMITDTAFYRYPHYHQLTDTPDKIDYERLALLTHGIFEIVLKLCGTESSPH
jgi:Zn-dependent M28 family amino/carboxypeptidase